MFARRIGRKGLGVAIAVGLALLVGCGDDDDSSSANRPLTVQLAGDQEVPPVQTNGSGTAEILIDEVAMEISVDVIVDGIAAGQLLMAHFHVAPAGENGGVVAFLLNSPPSDTSFSAIVTPDDIIPDTASGVETFDDLVQAIRNGGVYINIHTPTNPGGELRGQTG